MNIFLDNVPAGSTIGIDFNYFQLPASKPFHGFKHVPRYNSSNIHIVHFQHDESGIRYGYWINTESIKFCSFSYDSQREIMVFQNGSEPQMEYRFEQCQHLMLEYPENEDSDQWRQLVSRIKWKEVCHWVRQEQDDPNFLAFVDSTMTTAEESNLLQQRASNAQQSTILAPATESTLQYTPIRFKHPESMRPDHKMEDFLDKSYYLTCVILPKYHYSSVHSLMGELQFCYLNSVLFANYGSSMQWHNIIELVCFSQALCEGKYRVIMQELDDMLCMQTSRIPEEYMEFLINEALMARCQAESLVPLPHWKQMLAARAAEAAGGAGGGGDAAAADTNFMSRDITENNNFASFVDSESEEDEYQPAVASQVVYRRREA